MKKQISLFILLVMVFVGVGFADISSGLKAYYSFDGDVLDQSGNNKNGTNYNGVFVADRNGNEGQALYFNGNSRVEVPMIFSGDQDPLTYACWIKLDENSEGGGTLFAEMPNDGRTRNHFGLSGTREISFDQYGPSGGGVKTDMSVSLNEWEHIVFVKSSNTVYFYINGNLVKTDSHTETYSGVSPVVAAIGARWIAGSWTYLDGVYSVHGVIDDFRMYNRALSSSDVQELYEYNTQPPEPDLETGLKGHYSFDEETIDKSGNNSDGVASNITYVDGKFGKCADFNGQNSIITLGSDNFNFGTGDFSISIWVNIDNLSNDGGIISKRVGDGNGYSLSASNWWGPGRVEAFAGQTGDNKYSQISPEGQTINAATWHHLVFLRENGVNYKVYVDGVLFFSGVDEQVCNVSNSYDLHLGVIRVAELFGGYFDGKIDELRLYNRVLTSQEVSLLYTGEIVDTTNQTIVFQEIESIVVPVSGADPYKALLGLSDNSPFVFIKSYDNPLDTIALYSVYDSTYTVWDIDFYKEGQISVSAKKKDTGKSYDKVYDFNGVLIKEMEF